MDTRPPHSINPARFDPICLVLAWIWPGLGHLWMGQKRRGFLIMTGVVCMFVFGVLIGGVDVIDRENDALWFVPQVLAGPLAFGIDYLNLTFVKTGRIGMPSIGRVNELGTLYTALAGLMNLAAMIDATTRDPHVDMDRRDQGRLGDRRGVAPTSAPPATPPVPPPTSSTLATSQDGEPKP